MTAVGRAGVPDDIGPMVAALLSDENRWVNGQRIEVSGGMDTLAIEREGRAPTQIAERGLHSVGGI